MTRAPRKKPAPAAELDGAALEDGVHEALSRALFEGRLTPGSKLPEHRLATIFDVSRERIRKVLHRLVAERRLEAIPQRGVFIDAAERKPRRLERRHHQRRARQQFSQESRELGVAE